MAILDQAQNKEDDLLSVLRVALARLQASKVVEQTAAREAAVVEVVRAKEEVVIETAQRSGERRPRRGIAAQMEIHDAQLTEAKKTARVRKEARCTLQPGSN